MEVIINLGDSKQCSRRNNLLESVSVTESGSILTALELLKRRRPSSIEWVTLVFFWKELPSHIASSCKIHRLLCLQGTPDEGLYIWLMFSVAAIDATACKYGHENQNLYAYSHCSVTQRKGNRLPEPKAEGTCKRSLQAVRLTAGLGVSLRLGTICRGGCAMRGR